jgi:hypothetical protein
VTDNDTLFYCQSVTRTDRSLVLKSISQSINAGLQHQSTLKVSFCAGWCYHPKFWKSLKFSNDFRQRNALDKSWSFIRLAKEKKLYRIFNSPTRAWPNNPNLGPGPLLQPFSFAYPGAVCSQRQTPRPPFPFPLAWVRLADSSAGRPSQVSRRRNRRRWLERGSLYHTDVWSIKYRVKTN